MNEEIIHLQNEIAYNRDERAYERLYLRFYKRLMNFAFSYVKSKESAEEIVSDALMKVWTLQERLASVKQLDVYLFTVTKNASVRYLTKYRNYTSWDVENIPVELNVACYNLEDAILQAEFRKKVTEAIHSLPPKCQMVYKLVREEKFSYKQVAEIMEITENTVDRHLHIALQKLTASVKMYLLM